MTDEEKELKSQYLKAMKDSPGGQILFKHIEEEIVDGWNRFIDMPVDQKTSKASYDYQAKYKVLKGIKDWIESEIKLGE